MSAIPDGLVSGLALKHARATAGITQQDLAEAVDASRDTVQGWESGRRPFTRAAAGLVDGVRWELGARGADGPALQVLGDAGRADLLLRRILEPGERHVLAHDVITRDTCDALLWPVTGQPPRKLGVAAARPVLGAGQRAELAGSLRAAAESARGPAAPTLRRQAGFLLSADEGSAGFVEDMARDEMRRQGSLQRWTPSWPVARGLAIAQAARGNPEPLRAFLDRGLVTDDTIAANLRYYAHWTTADARPQRSDAFMAEGGDRWSAEQLLAALLPSLSTSSPHLELTVRTVWSLVLARPHVLGDPQARALTVSHASLALDTGTLRGDARRELGDVIDRAEAA